VLVGIDGISLEDLAEPYRFLARVAFDAGDLMAASRGYALAWAYFGTVKDARPAPDADVATAPDFNWTGDDTLRMYVAMAALCVKDGSAFGVQYELRPWHPAHAYFNAAVRDADTTTGGKGGKNAAAQGGKAAPQGLGFVSDIRPYPLSSVNYALVDTFYLDLRRREPTMHGNLEAALIELWAPFRAEVERKREEYESVLRNGKKRKK
jgi:hypothetical protein